MSLRTALDVDASQLDEHEQQFVNNIREYGWFDTHVFDGNPKFSYTTGFGLLGSPEFILFSLSQEVAHNILWDVYKDAAQGVRYPVGLPVEGLLGNAPAYLFEVSSRFHKEYLGWTRWFYAGEVPQTLQVIWPDRAGLFPWQSGFDESFRHSQLDLTEMGWANELSS